MRAWAAPEVPVLAPSRGVSPYVHAFDTATGRVADIGPSLEDDRKALLYVCGITPYDATHLGHASTYLCFDILNRVWRDIGLRVNYVQNVTNVDDPLLERAAQTGQDWLELANDEVELFRTDMAALRILPPNRLVAATDSISEVSDLIEWLRVKGSVYQIPDDQYPDWYFRSATQNRFGEVAHLPMSRWSAEFAAKGGDPDRVGKEHPLDALVWRQARPAEPSWDSSLGKGRPGWHIECTAIAQRWLGPTIDVQGGGSDLAFPHHEICAAQAQATTGARFARAFLHAGMVRLDGAKMSKSLGNLVLVSQLRSSGTDPMVIRLALLDHAWHDDWDWTPKLIDKAHRRSDAWRIALRAPKGPSAAATIAVLRTALRNNLDTRSALRTVDEWSAAVLAGDGAEASAPGEIARAVDALLGVRFEN